MGKYSDFQKYIPTNSNNKMQSEAFVNSFRVEVVDKLYNDIATKIENEIDNLNSKISNGQDGYGHFPKKVQALSALLGAIDIVHDEYYTKK